MTMTKRKKLTPEHYVEKFKDQMSRFNYIPRDGEIIVQAKAPYPSYWFVSNKGYVLSVHDNNLKILNDNSNYEGRKNKDGERTELKWRYKNINLPGGEVSAWKIVSDHFCECPFTGYEDEEKEIHHVKKKATFNPDESKECNQAANLQVLPKSIHDQLTNFAAKTVEKQDAEREEKARKAGIESQKLIQEQLLDLLRQRYKITDITDAVLYLPTINDDPSQIQARAYPIKWPLK